jgi:hypothetical protein
LNYVPIVDEIPVTEDTAEVLHEQLSETELPYGSLVSRDLRMAALLVIFDGNDPDFEAMRGMVDAVNATIKKYPVP